MKFDKVYCRGGFILPMALIMMMIVGIVITAVLGYVGWAARATRIYMAKDRCRFAAQSVIELAKERIQAGFSAYMGTSHSTIKISPRDAKVYRWFDADNISANGKVIGTGNSVITLEDPDELINGCSVVIGVRGDNYHQDDIPYVELPVVATATYTYPDGLKTSVTIEERICFATTQSQVFNYAYFVNNYGWMNGSSIYLNGDMRANGNISLTSSTVNGFVYGAINTEVNADGGVSLSSAKITPKNSYRGSATTTNRARPDLADYNTPGAYDAPASATTISLPSYVYDSDGNKVPKDGTGTRADGSGEPIANQWADSLPMPFVSELDSYIQYAQEYNEGAGGKLKYPAVTYTDGANIGHTLPAGTISAHFDGTGPSGNENLSDRGSIVLIGTQSNPIEIDGPVVVDGDVIIKGYVKGQGTIYAGRNIHIIGSITYVNSPKWSHPDGDDVAVEESNAEADLLGLVAKGNIVMGDSSSSSWYSTVGKYIKSGTSSSVVKRYACDASDAEIGYPATFQGDYTAKEYVAGKGDTGNGYFNKVRTATETYYETTTTTEQVPVYKTVTTGTGWRKTTKQVLDHYETKTTTKTEKKERTVLKDSLDRKYYETVCDDSILSSKSSSITQVDAVLYNNHGIFGTPGASGQNFYMNGSLVCRDEALIFSGNKSIFNWDMRLMPKRGNRVTDSLNLPVGPREPYTVSWQEVPNSLNPAYAAEGN